MNKSILSLIISSAMGYYGIAQGWSNQSSSLDSHAIYLRSMDVKTADLNRDGYVDIILAVEWAPNAILWGNAQGKFHDVIGMKLSAKKNDSEDIAIDDLDGNGWPDLVFAAEDDMNHELYLNFGNGVFKDVSERLPKFIANAVLAEDLNNDGYIDLIFGVQGQNVILINDSKANFTDETAKRFPKDNTTTQDLALVDVDRDGDLDLVSGNEDGNTLWINDGKGFFHDQTQSRLPQSKEIETRKVTVFDANGDGFMDLFMSNVASLEGKINQNKLYLNDGKGFFKDVTLTHLPIKEVETLDAIAMDVDGDGDLDLVLAYMGKVQPSIYLNDGNGKFHESEEKLPQVSGNNISIIAEDFNKDGKLDLYIGGFMSDDKLILRD